MACRALTPAPCRSSGRRCRRETVLDSTRQVAIAGVLALTAIRGAAEESVLATLPENVLLLDNLGRLVIVPPERVPARLRPFGGLGLKDQIPQPVTGAKMPREVQQRLEQARQGAQALQWLPAVQPRMMPYLASNAGE